LICKKPARGRFFDRFTKTGEILTTRQKPFFDEGKLRQEDIGALNSLNKHYSSLGSLPYL